VRDSWTGIAVGGEIRLVRKVAPSHRKDGPAHICGDPRTQVVTVENSYQSGTPPGEGAAQIRRNPVSGVVTLEVYARKGICMRMDGSPARIEWDPKSGDVIKQEYWSDGWPQEYFCKREITLLHRPRTERPATIIRTQHGVVIREEF
jgi:hypothetical protein